MKKLFTLCCISILTLCLSNGMAQNNVGIGTADPQAQLHTTGTVRLETLGGTGIHPVYAKANGQLINTPAQGFNTTAVSIPDNLCPGAASTINVAYMSGVTVNTGSIKVKLNITHEYDGDLAIYLVTPESEMINLAYSIGNTGDNFTNTILWDSAATSIVAGTAPYTGTFQPQGSPNGNCNAISPVTKFSELSGGSIMPNGNWSLWVFDHATGDVGILLNWSISFDGTNPQTPDLTADYMLKANAKGEVISGSIYDNGNIGIGTSTPAQKLDVAGGIKANSINVNTVTTPTTSTNNMLAVAYGYASANGATFNGSGNCTLAKTGTGVYEITFTSSDLAATLFGSVPVVATLSGSSGFIHYSGFTGKIIIYTAGTTNAAADKAFSFVVYKR